MAAGAALLFAGDGDVPVAALAGLAACLLVVSVRAVAHLP